MGGEAGFLFEELSLAMRGLGREGWSEPER